MSVHYMWAWCPKKPDKAIQSPQTVVTDFFVGMWVLGNEPEAPERAGNTFHHWDTSPDPS